jgi:hypothetical protein
MVIEVIGLPRYSLNPELPALVYLYECFSTQAMYPISSAQLFRQRFVLNLHFENLFPFARTGDSNKIIFNTWISA